MNRDIYKLAYGNTPSYISPSKKFNLVDFIYNYCGNIILKNKVYDS